MSTPLKNSDVPGSALTLAGICANAVSRRTQKQAAVLYQRRNRWLALSWTQYLDEIERAAQSLHGLGVGPGDRVAIMANTCLEWALLDFAILGIGAVTVPIYPTLTPNEMHQIIAHSEPKVVFLENAALWKRWQTIADKNPYVQNVVVLDREADLPAGVDGSKTPLPRRWVDFVGLGLTLSPEGRPNATKSFDFWAACHERSLDDLATILYTSGTTGHPKGVSLTHRQVMSEITDVSITLDYVPEDRALSFLPYSHIFGRVELWSHMLVGFTMAIGEGLERLQRNLRHIEPTILIGVPRVFEKLQTGIISQFEAFPLKRELFKWAMSIGLEVSQAKQRREKPGLLTLLQYPLAKELVLDPIFSALGGNLRFALSGGAPLGRDTAEFFHAIGLLILEGYGLSETTAGICVNTPWEYQFGTVGKPMGDVEIRLAEDGEILVKSDKVLREYYRDPEATAAHFSGEWFHTGDVGQWTPDGFLRITDRKKDLIKTAGGKYVAPQKLEGLLKRSPLISHVLIHGDRRKYVVALLTLNQSYAENMAKNNHIAYESFSDLLGHPEVLALVRAAVAQANRELASYETIKRFTVLPSDFSIATGELTPSLKIKRKYCEEKFAREIAGLYDEV